MKQYKDWAPTAMDPKGKGLSTKQEWFVAPCGINRDAGIGIETNWEAQKRELDKLDPDGQDHDSFSFNHWGNGWFDIMLVRPDSECFKFCQEFENSLSEYSCLDSNLLSEKECEEIDRIWSQMRLKERVELCQKARVNVIKARHDRVPNTVDSLIREHYIQY